MPVQFELPAYAILSGAFEIQAAIKLIQNTYLTGASLARLASRLSTIHLVHTQQSP